VTVTVSEVSRRGVVSSGVKTFREFPDSGVANEAIVDGRRPFDERARDRVAEYKIQTVKIDGCAKRSLVRGRVHQLKSERNYAN